MKQRPQPQSYTVEHARQKTDVTSSRYSNRFIPPHPPNKQRSTPMCLAIPAKVLNIKGNQAQVDFGGGVQREVNTALVDVKIGNYVLVHAGYAIQVLDEQEAQETLRLWNEILETEERNPR